MRPSQLKIPLSFLLHLISYGNGGISISIKKGVQSWLET